MTKPIFKLGREFDERNQFMKLRSNQLINDCSHLINPSLKND